MCGTGRVLVRLPLQTLRCCPPSATTLVEVLALESVGSLSVGVTLLAAKPTVEGILYLRKEIVSLRLEMIMIDRPSKPSTEVGGEVVAAGAESGAEASANIAAAAAAAAVEEASARAKEGKRQQEVGTHRTIQHRPGRRGRLGMGRIIPMAMISGEEPP